MGGGSDLVLWGAFDILLYFKMAYFCKLSHWSASAWQFPAIWFHRLLAVGTPGFCRAQMENLQSKPPIRGKLKSRGADRNPGIFLNKDLKSGWFFVPGTPSFKGFLSNHPEVCWNPSAALLKFCSTETRYFFGRLAPQESGKTQL